ncbi:hypothetical protein CKO38_08310 [Rhodospirillum rubrum]|uniref:hypothetical protein n=1 Tax=Rhodospirillum rubrum TaxID=1085 RepID=UPI0019046A78|nr:hypothetical protein [Rhodospirillum rubrum]MBK1663752.1 hypothetical protein [Rhodospirillum rubrum]MBK1676671.1 hypothetical protein [Rhodospirillum rubrum]
MNRTLPQSALAGLAGGLLFAAFVYVPALGFLLLQISVAPLLVAGLRHGLAGILPAAGVALLVTAALMPGVVLPVYAVVDLLPAVLVSALALRVVAAPGDGSPLWYPPGRILAWVSLLGLALLALFALGIPAGQGGIEAVVSGAVREAVDGLLVETSPDLREQILAGVPVYLPGTFLASWISRVALCAVLAQWWVTKRGGAVRPTPVYGALDLPSWLVGAFLICAAGALVLKGDAGYMAVNAAMGLMVPLVFMGLVLVHAAARQLPHPGIGLIGFYMLFVLGSAVAIAAVAFAGLVEFAIRRRPSPGGA